MFILVSLATEILTSVIHITVYNICVLHMLFITKGITDSYTYVCTEVPALWNNKQSSTVNVNYILFIQ